jgi:hypothetical protein
MKPPILKPKATIFLTLSTDTWTSMADVVKACKGKPVKITGTTLDLQDCQISGSKLPQPDDENDENSAPLRINITGFTMRNGSIRKIPGGIVFRKPSQTYRNLIFLDTGEDAISNIMDDSPDSTIRDCWFFGASDKSVQMNDARGLTFTHNIVVGGVTGIRIQKKATRHKAIKPRKIEGNTFINVDTAHHLAGPVEAVIGETTYENVNTMIKAVDGAKAR